MRILVAGYGLVAEAVIQSLLEQHGVSVPDLLCFTYATTDNVPLLDFLRKKGISFSTKSLAKQAAIDEIRDFSPDYIASLYYRDIIPGSILSLARIKAFNIHPSLLPKYRGCFSAPWAIIHGESETGITIHEMVEKVDQGPILWQKSISITEQDTGYSLYHRLCAESIREFNPFFTNLSHGRITPKEMPPGGSFFKRGIPYQGVIDPSWGDARIDSFIRAMFFPPLKGATLHLNGNEIEVSTFYEYQELQRDPGHGRRDDA
jgi:methionyl-tRNA formyltransferase